MRQEFDDKELQCTNKTFFELWKLNDIQHIWRQMISLVFKSFQKDERGPKWKNLIQLYVLFLPSSSWSPFSKFSYCDQVLGVLILKFFRFFAVLFLATFLRIELRSSGKNIDLKHFEHWNVLSERSRAQFFILNFGSEWSPAGNGGAFLA